MESQRHKDREFQRRTPNSEVHGFRHKRIRGASLEFRLCAFVSLCLCVYGLALSAPQQSPASQQPPLTVKPQSYPPELVISGQTRFASECGFCHGRDAAGGETGPDLTRSTLVAEDSRGDKIIPLVRAGRVDKGMPSFDTSDAELEAMVAFIHDQKTKGESLGGGRRSVDLS